jgi:thiol-disulfide isomerase/thioredoxin
MGAYLLAWSTIMDLVAKGHSWSGNERNCCYLNEGAGRFANISRLSGLDARDDGRAIAVMDWDQDGDLDLWFRNRSAPRVRLKLNRHRPDAGQGSYVAVRLRGTKANRDGVGAVVEVVLAEDGKTASDGRRLVKSLRAGDLFLSQSSKWLHFGLGAEDRIREIMVLWPGGRKELFGGVKRGGRYLLREGSGTAKRHPDREGPEVLAVSSRGVGSGSPVLPDQASSGARIRLPSPIPLPFVSWRDQTGQPRSLVPSPGGGLRLLVLWSSSCPHCRAELSGLAEGAAALRGAGLDVLALSTDGFDENGQVADTSRVYNEIDAVDFPFGWGFVDQSSLDRIQHVQTALFDRAVPPSVPLTFLLDGEGNALALYRGPQKVEHMIEDARTLAMLDREERLHLALPLAGRWFTKPLGPGQIAEFMAREFHPRHPEQALNYLQQAVALVETAEERAILVRDLSKQHHFLARRYREEEPQKAASHFEAALKNAAEPVIIYDDYARMQCQYGRLDEAEVLFRKALALDPELAVGREGLELVERLRAEQEKR